MAISIGQPRPPRQYRPIAAAFWMSGSIGGFSALAVAGREIGASLDTFEIMLYRSLIGVVIVWTVAAAYGHLDEIRPRRLGLHALRNTLHFAGQNLWLHALLLIPLAQLFALEFSYPIIVALAAPLFLAEVQTPRKLLAAGIGFVGVLIVAQPFGSGGISVGLVAALACAVGFAGSAIVTKKLTGHASVTGILFWLTAMQSGMSLACAGWDGVIALPSGVALPWVAVMGLAGLGAHLCLTKALSLAPASLVAPMDFLRLPLIGVIGMALYREPLDMWVFVGGGVIFLANWLNVVASSRMRARGMATETEAD